MRFVEPQMLYLLLLVPLLLAGAMIVSTRRKKALRKFAGGHANLSLFTREISGHRRTVKLILLLSAVVLLISASARPQYGSRLEKVSRSGVDVVVVIDTSLSMAANDLSPNRLEIARHTAGTLMKRLAGNRVALVGFAGRAVMVCPLTLDHEAARLFLDTIDLQVVSVQGTALAEALQKAMDSFDSEHRYSSNPERSIILLSDGEDHEEGLDKVINRLKQVNIAVHAIGVGTASGGPIPVVNDKGGVAGYKKDREGKVVTSRLDGALLENLARRTGGQYYRSTPAGLEIDGILEAITGLQTGELGSVMRTRYEERFQYPLVLAVLLLVSEMLIPDRKSVVPREAA